MKSRWWWSKVDKKDRKNYAEINFHWVSGLNTKYIKTLGKLKNREQ